VAGEPVPDGVPQPVPAGPSGVGTSALQLPPCVVAELVLDGALVGDAALDRVPVRGGVFGVVLTGDGALDSVPVGGATVDVGGGPGAVVEPFKVMVELPLLW